MTDWQIVHGSQEAKPAELDTTSSKVYVYQRRNVQRVTVEDSEFGTTNEFWQYEERKLTREEWANMRAAALEEELTQAQLALVEIYEQIGG